MIVYRLASKRFPVCDGEGARLYGGRWNRAGRAAVYTAGTQSLEEIHLSGWESWETEDTRPIRKLLACAGKQRGSCVPSKVIPVEFNSIPNPAHQDFQRLLIADPEPFRFDRLLLDRFISSR